MEVCQSQFIILILMKELTYCNDLRYLSSSHQLPGITRVQGEIDKHLSRTAQLQFAKYFQQAIENQAEKWYFPSSAKDIHWKDICKLVLHRMLYGKSLRAMSDIVFQEGDAKKSTLGDILGWAKYKTESFHRQWILPFDHETRVQAAMDHNSGDNYFSL